MLNFLRRVNFKLLYALAGMVMHCFTLLVITAIVMATGKEKLMWKVLAQIHTWNLVMWTGLGLISSAAPHKDVWLLYLLSWLVSLSAKWIGDNTYDRDMFTACTIEAGQCFARYLIAKMF